MANIDLNLLLDVQASLDSLNKLQKDAAKSLNQIAKDATKSTDSVKKGFDGLGAVKLDALLGIFGKGIQLAKAFANALSVPIKAAAEFEDAINGVRSAFAQVGIQSEFAVQSIVDFASEIQRTTRFSDDAVLSSTALISSLSGLSGTALKRATTAALDLSTALGIDLTAASNLVAKAAAGNISAFSRYGLTIKAGKNSAETFANTLTVLESKFGGASLRAVNTFGGSVDQLQNNFDDAIKTIGLAIINNESFLSSIKVLSQETLNFIKNLDVKAISNFASAIGSLISITGKTTGFFASLANETVSFTNELIEASKIGLNDFIDRITTGGKSAKFFQAELKQLRVSAVNAGDDFIQLAQAAKQFANDDLSLKKQLELDVQAKFSAETAELQKNLESLTGSLKNAGQGTIDFAKNQYEQQEKLLKSSLNRNLISTKEFNTLSARNQQQYQKEVEKITKESQEKQLKVIQDAASNPAQAIVKGFKSGFKNSEVSAIGAGILAEASKGSSGAASLFSQGLGAIADTFLPGIGGAVAQIVGVLAQGPEQAAAFFTEFIRQIPVVISNIVRAIPAVILALVREVPKLITALIRELPKFGAELARQAPFIAVEFVKALIAEAPKIAEALIDAVLSQSTGGLLGNSDSGTGIGGIIGGIGDFFGFAEGGQVPGGAPFVDRVPAMLTPGEQVIDRSLSERLESFLSGGGGGGQQNINITLQVGEKELADVLLSLNRRGFRTA